MPAGERRTCLWRSIRFLGSGRGRRRRHRRPNRSGTSPRHIAEDRQPTHPGRRPAHPVSLRPDAAAPQPRALPTRIGYSNRRRIHRRGAFQGARKSTAMGVGRRCASGRDRACLCTALAAGRGCGGPADDGRCWGADRTEVAADSTWRGARRAPQRHRRAADRAFAPALRRAAARRESRVGVEPNALPPALTGSRASPHYREYRCRELCRRQRGATA